MDTSHGPAEGRTTESAWGRLALIEDVSFSSLGHSQFIGLVVNERFPHTRFASWATTAASVDDALPFALTTHRDPAEDEAVLALAPVLAAPCVARVCLRDGQVSAWMAARELHVLGEADGWLRGLFPELGPTADHRVPVWFWAAGARGPRCVSRRIAVPSWDDVRANYPAAVADRLDRLVAGLTWAAAGQLVLWHGPPGTGKTFALRALAWEWRTWCETHYIIDSEVFWGEGSSYLLDVLLQEEEDEEEGDDVGKWRLLVLEDTGELLSADAKERSGQGLSRLLNVVDGMVGQGFRVLVLVTTNEPLRALHEAVARPGRCAARVEFAPFGAEEARRWLADRGVACSSSSSRTLAELFTLADGRELPARQPLGFGR